ncbi:ACP S-malonyltransferase [Loigolactobacillus bifermentans]|uniref:Malonyl CoA-acyl carrier protein transacylase n=1 Tax=Loigolactobacillus bifermentans DSM 20003 TaxID=1423726 RepID=A0A0R1H094_9LACO|nr:ACP S-malonyltransferase [Loigolactobacillus bifermentans]KRK39893.1 [Acyl-carrier-protein] S-malonyltransferase [Loigolactobacillus bifermentans DSM 20003]QGG60443.1 ACP S-malonyltransferase [Loigolactobacillus bifermentans]
MKYAILFSGQGAQFAGMGQTFDAEAPLFHQHFMAYGKALGWDLPALCFTENERLQETAYAQAAIVAYSLAVYESVKSLLPAPTAMLGLSLGEYSALAASGFMTATATLQLVQQRGRLMAQAAADQPGAMAAVMNATPEQLAQACQADDVTVANYNTPKQVVLSGTTAGVAQASAILKQLGVRRVLPLPVSGAFHSALMQPAQAPLAAALAQTTVQAGQVPVWSNTTQQPFTVATLRDTLTQQLVSPTYFATCLQALAAQGVTHFIEMGPGKTLTQFVRKTIPEAQAIAIQQPTDLVTLPEILHVSA